MAKSALVPLENIPMNEVKRERPDRVMTSNNLRGLVIHGVRIRRKKWVIVMSYTIRERITDRDIPMKNKVYELQSTKDGKLWAYIDLLYGDFRAVMFT